MHKKNTSRDCDNRDNNDNSNNNDLLTDPLGGSSLLNYINYNCKINQIKLFTNYSVELGLTESNYSKTDKSLCTLFLKKFLESLKKVL